MYASLDEINSKYRIPDELQSCHAAIVNGYAVVGHVPVKEINRMLAEEPDIIGIGVAGMPIGSPGMEIEGFEDEAYDVVSFDQEGKIKIYSSYPGQ